jgi:hypothetical protein
MTSFLFYICDDHIVKEEKWGKRKTVNQYWQDFKML